MLKKFLTLMAFSAMSILGANAQAVVFPQADQPGTAVVAQTDAYYVLSNQLFKAQFNKANGVLTFGGSEGLHLNGGTELFKLTLGNGTVVTSSQMTLGTVEVQNLAGNASAVKGSHRLDGKQIVANYTYGNLKLVWRAVLRNGSHYLRTELDITATADQAMTNIIPMLYSVNTTTGGTPAVVGNTRGAVLASDKIFAGLETPMGQNTVSGSTIQGLWSRATTLEAGETWNVGAVVGLVADGQQRRSFLAYSERERAVPWRAFPLYNSWYELNINRNNASSPSNNMSTAQATDVLAQWKTKLFDAHGVGIKSFVWDDGWDNYQTWECHSNFSFDRPSADAEAMGSGTGVWLSPVGGYGTSGDKRRSYWSSRGGMVLSNDAYYKVFKTAALNFINNYNCNFFKFDGISQISNATGPDSEEDAEGIISMERDMRTLKEDIFLNTTVGTWASPFWYQFTDATWRQDQDYNTLGKNSSDRENWVTYRDQLVYKNYVQNSPLCPINTLMTHGFILADYYTTEGILWWKKNVYVASTDWNYDAVLREMRCAFACGSGMVELYCDYDLMNSIKNTNGTAGALWADLAECIEWQKENSDVLPDIHWVGGNPYDGSKHNIYGWASWNGKKATLALRNGGTSTMTYTTTLREVFEIPSYISGVSIVLSKAFSHGQADLSGLSTGTAIDIDTQITVSLPASSVYVFDGVQTPETTFEVVEEPTEPEVVVVETPTISPAGGEVEEGAEVTLACATEGATIRYTLDGTEPTASSTAYTSPIAISSACTLKAVAMKDGCTTSGVATAAFTIKAREVVATPVFSPAGGEYESSVTVSIACATEGASVYYTLDGTVPTAASTLYSGAITITESATLQAIAVKDGYYTNSSVASAVYTITQPAPVQVSAPVISPAGGEYESSVTVSIACATEGASVYYTLDGSAPTAASTLYSGAITITESATLQAIAVKEGNYTNSSVVSAVYTITQPVEPEEPETPEIDAELQAAIDAAQEVVAYTGVGYPSTSATVRTTLVETIANAQAGNADASDLASAVSAFKNEVSDIAMPENGMKYTFTSVSKSGKKMYLKYSSSGISFVSDASQATEYTCKVINASTGKYAFVTDAGKYLIWKGPSGSEGWWIFKKTYGYNDNLGYLGSYNSTYCDLVVEKLCDGGNVSADSNADLFGMMAIKGWRYSRSEYGYFTIKNDGSFDASSSPYFNSTYSSAIMIQCTGASASARIKGGDEATAIETIEAEKAEQNGDEKMYDLTGRKVKDVRSGQIFIKDGKIVMKR